MAATTTPSIDQRAYLAALAEANGRLIAKSPADFARVLSENDAEPWLPYRHLMYVNSHLLRLVDPDDPLDRLLVTLPFRHGKSLFGSTYFPAWYLNRYPEKRVILSSYADEFAERWGGDVRQLIEQNPDKLSVHISKSSAAKNRWDVDGHRGGMKTAGVGGQLTGWGAHLFIVDDPVKDADEAHSLVQRENKWRWWNTVAQSRLEPGGVVLVIGTRYHEDDFIGRLLTEQKDRWTHINLPALAEDDDALGRHPGQALCPERYNENALAMIRNDITPSAWLSGYQQRPTPEGGGRFRRDDFRYWSESETETPCYTLLPGKGADETDRIVVPKADCGRFVTVDTALSLKTSADYTVAGVWDIAGWLTPPRLILVDILRVRMEGADHLHWLDDIKARYHPTWIGVEDVSLSMTLISQAQRAGLPVRRLKPEKDKYGRSESAVVALQNHRVYFPKHLSWYGDFEHELLSFPAGTHDDQVDVFSYACREFMAGYGRLPKPKPAEPTTTEDKIWAQVRRNHRRSSVHPSLGRWH